MHQRAKRRLKLERLRKEQDQLLREWSRCEITANPGFDYSLGTANHRGEFHFGVISAHACCEFIYEAFEADYGPPTCGKCGNEAIEADDPQAPDIDELPEDWETIHAIGGADYACLGCKRFFSSDDAFGEEPVGNYLDDGEYKASLDGYNDIFITQSPYFTYAQYCSPCAPGAGHLENPCPPGCGGIKTYCFGHDWFNGDKAPYPVFSVKTGKLVLP